LTVLTFPCYSGFPLPGGENPAHSLTFWTFNEKQAARDRGSERQGIPFKGGSGPWGGSRDTLRGVSIFRTSLYEGTLCSGFAGHNREVSGLREVYSEERKASFGSREASSLQPDVKSCTHTRCQTVYQPGYSTSTCTGRHVHHLPRVQGRHIQEERYLCAEIPSLLREERYLCAETSPLPLRSPGTPWRPLSLLLFTRFTVGQ